VAVSIERTTLHTPRQCAYVGELLQLLDIRVHERQNVVLRKWGVAYFNSASALLAISARQELLLQVTGWIEREMAGMPQSSRSLRLTGDLSISST
jgi:hypothetical protein